MRELLIAHQKAILRELSQSRHDMRLAIAQLREDQRVDNEAVQERLSKLEERAQKTETRVAALGALHALAGAVLGFIAHKVFMLG